MTTIAHLPETAIPIDNILLFIKRYRELEKLAIKDGNGFIHAALHMHKNIAIQIPHLCDHWRYKERDFGLFWSNLDVEAKIHICRYWTFDINGADEYLEKIWSDPLNGVFIKSPALIRCFDNVIMFFNNHGIYNGAIEEFDFPVLPPKEKQFGNSSNWADYFLSFSPLMKAEMHSALTLIRDFYPKNRLTN